MPFLRKFILSAVMSIAALSNQASAVALFDLGTVAGSGATAGSGEVMVPRGDDVSVKLSTAFSLKLGNTVYDSLYLNNNGNVSFNAPISGWNANPFPLAMGPMLAPFWGDVDTRGGGGGVWFSGMSTGLSYSGTDRNVMGITWDRVATYPTDTSKGLNTFQLLFWDRSDSGLGNFDFEFRYIDLNWLAGTASSTSAAAGWDMGDGVNYYNLPGSRTNAMQNLENVVGNVGEVGRWVFHVRDGLISSAVPAEVPEPGSLLLIAIGLIGFAMRSKRRASV